MHHARLPRTLVIVSSFAGLAALAGCGGGSATAEPAAKAPTTEPAHAEAKPGAGPLKAPGEAKIGDTTKCPISGEEFTVEASSPKVEHDGKTYFFCCAGCRKKFAADPAKYVKSST